MMLACAIFYDEACCSLLARGLALLTGILHPAAGSGARPKISEIFGRALPTKNLEDFRVASFCQKPENSRDFRVARRPAGGNLKVRRKS